MADYSLRYKIVADGKQAKNELAEVERSIERLSGRGRSGGSGFADVLGGTLAADAITKFSGLLADGGRAVLDYSAKLEQTKISFQTLMGGAEQAAKHIDELRKLSTSTPLEFQSLTKMSQRLQGAGIAAKDVTALIKDIGNTAAATGDLTADRMEGIGVAISQVFAKGKVSAEEMEQLAERGIPAWRILSQQLGLTIGQTRELAEKGKITSQQFLDAFQQFTRMNFGDAMQKQAATFTGAMNVITNIAMVTAEQAFRPIFEKISTFGADVARSLREQQGTVENAGVSFGFALGEAIAAGVEQSGLNGYFSNFFENQFAGLKLLDTELENVRRGYLKGSDPVTREFRGFEREQRAYEEALQRYRSLTAPKPATMPGGTPGTPKLGKGGDAMKRFFEEELGAVVTSFRRTPGALTRFGTVSKHGSAEAVDIRTRNRTIDEIFSITVRALEKGYRLFDERNTDKPHQHWEANSRRASTFLGAEMYGGPERLAYLKELDRKRLGKETGLGGFAEFTERRAEDVKRETEESQRALLLGLDRELQLYEANARHKLAALENLAGSGLAIEMQLLTDRQQIERDSTEFKIEQLNKQLEAVAGNAEEEARLLQEIVLAQGERDAMYARHSTERFRQFAKEQAALREIADQAERILQAEKERFALETQRVMDSIGGPADDAGTSRTGDMIFGDAALGRIDEATGRVRNMSDVLGQLGSMAGEVFMQMGQGLGTMLEQWVLLGDQADVSMKKMVASVLAGVASQAATLSIFHLAMGIAALTPWGAVMYGPAAFQFKSAALWAGIAAGTAIGGRAIAGDSFQSGGASASAAGGVGGSSASSGTLQPFSRASDQAFMSGRSDLSQAVSELSAEVRGLKQKLSGMRPGDVLVAGAREKRGFIGYQVARDIRTNANAGTVLLKNAGFRN